MLFGGHTNTSSSAITSETPESQNQHWMRVPAQQWKPRATHFTLAVTEIAVSDIAALKIATLKVPSPFSNSVARCEASIVTAC